MIELEGIDTLADSDTMDFLTVTSSRIIEQLHSIPCAEVVFLKGGTVPKSDSERISLQVSFRTMF